MGGALHSTVIALPQSVDFELRIFGGDSIVNSTEE